MSDEFVDKKGIRWHPKEMLNDLSHRLETANNRLRQISKLCRELVNELKDVYYILGEYREEYSKVYEIADEIEGWLTMENEE
jgi:predicted transcriptional regulator